MQYQQNYDKLSKGANVAFRMDPLCILRTFTIQPKLNRYRL